MKKTSVVIALFFLILLCFSSCLNSAEWPQKGLGAMLPKPDNGTSYIIKNLDESFYAQVNGVLEEERDNYIDKCRKNGFSIEESLSSYAVYLFNQQGYRLTFYEIGKDYYTISLEAPYRMDSFWWPGNEIGQMVPPPSSDKCFVEWSNDEGFCIHIGGISQKDYTEYIDLCYASGFDNNITKTSLEYVASNKDGYNLDVLYEGFNTICIRLSAQNETIPETEAEYLSTKEDTDTVSVPETQVTPETQNNPEIITDTPATETSPQPSLTMGQLNALGSAKSYLSFSAFSYKGLVEQLEYEKYTHDEAVYAADNCGADWNEQALKSAKNYLEFSAFSRKGLMEQLEFEGFTSAQSEYGVNNCGADWNEQAVKSAKQYLSFMSFSKSELIEQLEFEGFSHDQAVYGVEANGY
ncbi:MAG: Ltp family lipoprotein [Clostridia bacterium]|nr:Ltp family lipoprotein [Clostridia bacterium]